MECSIGSHKNTAIFINLSITLMIKLIKEKMPSPQLVLVSPIILTQE